MKGGETVRDCDMEEERVTEELENRGEGGEGTRKWRRARTNERVREKGREGDRNREIKGRPQEILTRRKKEWKKENQR